MTADRAATTIARVVEAMVGTSPAELFPPRTASRPLADGRRRSAAAQPASSRA